MRTGPEFPYGFKDGALRASDASYASLLYFPTQDEFTLRLTGLPLVAPDQPATVIEVECDGEPAIDHSALRSLWPRYKVGVSF
jgi:hypothetical protein